jgi:hypothetical protein
MVTVSFLGSVASCAAKLPDAENASNKALAILVFVSFTVFSVDNC